PLDRARPQSPEPPRGRVRADGRGERAPARDRLRGGSRGDETGGGAGGRRVAELGGMVAAGPRRRGIGSALIEEAMNWARDLGIVRLELTVFPHNAPAIALYRKLGFQEEGILRRRYFIDGRYVDAMLMGLDLDSRREKSGALRAPLRLFSK